MSLALLCPGQGGQHAAMFARVHADPLAAPVLDAASAALGRDVRELVVQAERYANRCAQPLVCAGALAHWQALRPHLPAPRLVLGYSVGELAAHAVAGSFDDATCLALAAERARLMDAASPADAGLLAVVGLRGMAIGQLCDRHGVAVAIVNGEDHYVLGGPSAALQAVAEAAAARGARTVALPVSVPAHTHWLQAAADAFAERLRTVAVRVPATPVLAGIDGLPVTTAARVAATLAAQIAHTVQWHYALTQAVERGARVFLELGPGGALARMLRDGFPGCEARAVEDFQTLEGVAEWVAGACARAA